MDDIRTVLLVALALAIFLPGLVVVLMSGGQLGFAAVGALFVLGALVIVWSERR